MKAHAKLSAAQTELHAIHELQQLQEQIEGKREHLKKAEATKFASIKKEISSDLQHLEITVSALHHKVEHLVSTI